MGLVVTGTLVTTDGKIQTEASASDLADTGAVHAGVTGKVDTNDEQSAVAVLKIWASKIWLLTVQLQMQAK